MKIALRLYVAQQDLVIQLLYKPVGSAPVTTFLDIEDFFVPGAVGFRQDIGQGGSCVLRVGGQGCRFRRLRNRAPGNQPDCNA